MSTNSHIVRVTPALPGTDHIDITLREQRITTPLNNGAVIRAGSDDLV
jgi:hypothetical protein